MVALQALPHVNVAAPTFRSVLSYGHLACALSEGLQQRGYLVNEMGGHARSTRITPTLGGFLLGYPTNFHLYPTLANSGKRVAVTMFESTRLPDGWAAALNRCAAVIVPAQFLVQVFKDAGVIVPIHVVPLGVDAIYTQTVRRYRPRQAGTFNVLVIGDGGNRKNHRMAVLAFHKAFGDDPRYQLIIKCRSDSLRYFAGYSNPNITLLRADYNEAQMAALYRRSHVMLFPTRGEGFGLPPREFAATGGVVLASDWGGTADDLVQWGVPIATLPEPAWKHHEVWENKMGEWGNPSVEDMAAKLRAVAADYRAYARQALTAAQFVKDTYRWDRFVEGCLNVYASI